MSRNSLELEHPFNQLDDSSVAIIDFAFDFLDPFEGSFRGFNRVLCLSLTGMTKIADLTVSYD